MGPFAFDNYFIGGFRASVSVCLLVWWLLYNKPFLVGQSQLKILSTSGLIKYCYWQNWLFMTRNIYHIQLLYLKILKAFDVYWWRRYHNLWPAKHCLIYCQDSTPPLSPPLPTLTHIWRHLGGHQSEHSRDISTFKYY